MVNNLLYIDKIITDIINMIIPHNLIFNSFFLFFSQYGNSIFIWAAIIFLLIVFEEKKDKRFVFYFLTGFGITALIVNIILKNIFERTRPFVDNSIILINNFYCPTDFSFPSSHAATAFAGAAILSHFDKKRRIFYYLTATLIALSRIYLGCHYFFDVMAGSIFGLIIAVVLLTVIKKLKDNRVKRFFRH